MSDTGRWYQPKIMTIDEFKIEVDDWIKYSPHRSQSKNKEKDEVGPTDSASVVSQRPSRSSHTSSASACQVARAEKAALLAKAAALKQRHALEVKEECLIPEREELIIIIIIN